MSESESPLMCSACGEHFTPRAEVARCFCPHCGKPVDIAQARAIEEMLRAAQATMREAQAAARQAEETCRQAERDAEEAKRQAEEQRAAFEAQQEEMRRQEEAWRTEKAREQAAREQAAREQAAREAAERERAAREAAAREQAAREQAAREAAAREAVQPQYRRNAVVRDSASGRGLFLVTLPTNWRLSEAALLRGDSSSRPYLARASFGDGEGGQMNLELGDAGMRMSESMRATMAMYGAALAGVDRTNYAEMPDPRMLADDAMRHITQEVDGPGVRLVREVGSTRLGQLQQMGHARFKRAARSSGGALLKDPFAAELTRIYEFSYRQIEWKLAAYVRLYAIRDASGVDMLNPAGMVVGLGSAVGGLLGRRGKRKGAQDTRDGSVAGATGAWSLPEFESYRRSGSIYWDVAGIAVLFAPVRTFDRLYQQAFVPLVSDFELHEELISLAETDARQDAAAMQQATNQQISRMNAQTQAALAADRQRQAAFDAQLASWHAQSDAHHAAFRERTNAEFRGSGTDGGVGDWSEAIRGVNTFVTSDGREVELDVSADRAYENQAGDVIGGSGVFDPGADWTEIPRA
ncbi:MAG: hypothetical protein IKF14_15135 [Atopobiaceae bacterium]|nr:hypothetical protein [Atopobiaceae bacterium]